MNDTAEVYLWGTRIGIIHQDNTKPYASFEYDPLGTGLGVHNFLAFGRQYLPIGQNAH